MAVAGFLLTGGSGRLGRELTRLLDDVAAPPRRDLDVTRREMVEAAIDTMRPAVVIHAAAFTDVAAAEHERATCWRTNVVGTRAVVAACRERGTRLVHISTDYVFFGDRDFSGGGGYDEEEPPGPVRNYYALSKLAAEEIARTHARTLVIRTSFRPRAWPYPVAFDDVFTSQDYVDVIAPDIALAIRHIDRIPYDTLHIATERKSVLELARRRRPDVKARSKREAQVALPDDITLDISRWRSLKSELTS